ncbi:MAG TPA: OmpA family protein, partial [Longimicrobiaceae bacterium]
VGNHALKLEMNVTFATGQSQVPASAATHLDALASSLREFGGTQVVVVGHTDNVGTPARNRILSQLRAQAVVDYLKARGVEETRLTAQGKGSEMPVADNATPEGRARNRRVEVTIEHSVAATE